MRITKTHAMMSIEDARERPTRMIQSHEVCTEHRGKLLDLYCNDHQYPVCATCIAYHHRHCDTVMATDRGGQTVRTRRANRSLQHRLKHAMNVVESVLAHKEGSRGRLLNRKEAILDEVSKLKMSVISLMDELEEKLKVRSDIHKRLI